MSELNNISCGYQFCEYIDVDNDNLCYNCEHHKDCQCHKSRDVLKEELDALKEKLHIEKAYRNELSDEISNLMKANNSLKTVLKTQEEYRYELMETNTTLEVGLITAYIIIAIFAGLLMLK
jgi:hypothetical protein